MAGSIRTARAFDLRFLRRLWKSCRCGDRASVLSRLKPKPLLSFVSDGGQQRFGKHGALLSLLAVRRRTEEGFVRSRRASGSERAEQHRPGPSFFPGRRRRVNRFPRSSSCSSFDFAASPASGARTYTRRGRVLQSLGRRLKERLGALVCPCGLRFPLRMTAFSYSAADWCER